MILQYISNSEFFIKITRRKNFSKSSTVDKSSLSQVLSTFDLVNLGVGSILGAGLYVVTGQVVLHISGPSAIFSFILAAFASLLAGLCYAEFSSRVPKTTGSAYSYSYYSVGELFAYFIGWNLVLEYIIGTAADARALSEAIDHLMSNRIKNWTLETFGLVPFFNYEYDFLAVLLSLVATIILAVGVKESARCTTLFNVLNISIAIFIIIFGSIYSNKKFWGIDKGGNNYSFSPTGASGIFRGAATCFYAFVGFDIVATTGEEAKNPMKSIPMAISATLFICLILYLGVGMVISLMIGFNEPSLEKTGYSIMAAFKVAVGSENQWSQWIVGFGSVFGLVSSLMGSLFPLPRIIYAMSKDGLLFSFFTKVCAKTETPIFATIFPGILTAIFSLFLDLTSLVEMMSSGTLLAYSLVCSSVLLLRYYRPNDIHNNKPDWATDLCEETFENISTTYNPIDKLEDSSGIISDGEDELTEIPIGNGPKDYIKVSSNSDETIERQNIQYDNKSSNGTVNWLTLLVWIDSFMLALCLKSLFSIEEYNGITFTFYIILIATFMLVLVVSAIKISRFPQDRETLKDFYFSVPFLPYLPILAIFINICLMVQLSMPTWIRFIVWNLIGLFTYIFYGMKNAGKKFEKSPGNDGEEMNFDSEECLLLDRSQLSS